MLNVSIIDGELVIDCDGDGDSSSRVSIRPDAYICDCWIVRVASEDDPDPRWKIVRPEGEKAKDRAGYSSFLDAIQAFLRP